MPRRIEELERRGEEKQPASWTDEMFLHALERLAEARSAAAPAVFWPVWEAYLAVRGRLAEAEPPPTYRPDLTERRRRWLWRGWNHPELDAAVEGLLRALAEGGRARG